MEKQMKTIFVSQPGLENFMMPIVESLESDGHDIVPVVTHNQQELAQAVVGADVVWIEWADDLAQRMTTDMALLNQKKVILRIHSYEAFASHIDYINWERINHLIFVSEYIRDLVLTRVPKIKKLLKDNIHIIPNGVDLTKHKFIHRDRNKNIAYVGYINHKKGPMLLLHAMQNLVSIDPEFKLFIAGKFQEPRYELYFKQMSRELKLEDNIIFDGWQSNIHSWLVDKSYIVSSSILESQGMGILEAMATGCKPLVHSFVGWQHVYPEKFIWKTINEFKTQAVSARYAPLNYRAFVSDKYNLTSEMVAIKAILKDCEPIVLTAPKRPTSIQTKLTTKLSVVMMVKDESKNLHRCLNSVQGFADEIIVVDTGSTDDSREICKQYGAKVYDHMHPGAHLDSFSKYRNIGMEYAEHPWILQIDADEEFKGNGKKLKRVLANDIPEEVCGIQFPLYDVTEEDNNATSNSVQFTPLRIFRKGKIEYREIVHNEPIVDGEIGHYADAYLLHYGYHGDPGVKKQKSERTIRLLHKRLENNINDSKALFYLFQSYCDIGQIDKGIRYGERYIRTRLVADDFNASVYYSLITAYLSKGNLSRAWELLNEGMAVIPNDLDLCMATIEYGVLTNNGSLVLEGAQKYQVAYDYINQNQTGYGIRFVYGNRPETLSFVLQHAAMVHLQAGSIYLKAVGKNLKNVSSSELRSNIRIELKKNLGVVGLTQTKEGENHVNKRKGKDSN